MRKPNFSALILVTIVFAAFTLGFFLGKNQNHETISVNVSADSMTVPPQPIESEPEPTQETVGITFPISLNDADKDAFMALPGIGDVLAQRIMDYRAENGSFSAVEDLLNVEGIGKQRLEEILDLIYIGG